MTTSVPKISVTKNGLNIPLESDVLAGVLSDFDQAFGGNLNQNLETPQGQLASSFSAIIADKNNGFAEMSNSFDPEYADGVWQDALAKIYFLSRRQATKSTVYCDVIGLAGTVIPSTFKVKDLNGNMWTITEATAIQNTGTVSALFECDEAGAVEALAGTVSIVYQALVGLDRISNQADAMVGENIESRTDFELRRKSSVEINAHGVPQAVRAGILELKGVTDCFVYDNVQDSTVNFGSTNYPLKPHSIFVSVVGGNKNQIADVIWRKAGNGCNYNGNIDVSIFDDSYSDPKPKYKVSFLRPAPRPVHFKVVVSANSGALEDSVRTAIVSDFSAGSNKPRIGGVLYAMNFSKAVLAAIGGSVMLEIKVSADGSTWADYVTFGIDQSPTITSSNIVIEEMVIP